MVFTKVNKFKVLKYLRCQAMDSKFNSLFYSC